MDKDELAALMSSADATPDDVATQIAAAYGNDRFGSEEAAIRYYDIAWNLGVPEDERKRFMVGYGSTLRNVGRVKESIAIYRQAIEEYPGYAPNHAFLALSFHNVNRHAEALAASLDALLESGTDNLDGYDRALRYYRDTLNTDS